MPEIGEIRKALEVGRKGAFKYIWQSCSDCGTKRWVCMNKAKPVSFRCASCARIATSGEAHPHWKGGRYKLRGYVLVKVYPRDFFLPMARINKHHSFAYALEHRLVMAKHLGRCLQSWELVHHKNGIKDDNRLENLELGTRGGHTLDHGRGYREGYRKGLIDGRLKQVEELKIQNEELRKQIKLLQLLIQQKIGYLA